MNESQARDRIAQYGKSIFDRGLTAGTSGNISVKVGDGWLMTPTNSSDRKSTRLNSSHMSESRMPSSA